jgi:hypothetical protein
MIPAECRMLCLSLMSSSAHDNQSAVILGVHEDQRLVIIVLDVCTGS